MIQLPTNLTSKYTAFLNQRGVKAGQHRYYLKWLRYYLDFCHKYNFRQTANESLSAFMEKLREKKQAENLRKQAHHAISLFCEMEHCSSRKVSKNTSHDGSTAVEHNSSETPPPYSEQIPVNQTVRSDTKIPSHAGKPPPGTSMMLRQKGSDWTKVFTDLKNAIKIRHYSPKTLKTYSGWTRKFQTYIKSKDPRLISPCRMLLNQNLTPTAY